jgi:hypothetical protein
MIEFCNHLHEIFCVTLQYTAELLCAHRPVLLMKNVKAYP